MLASNSSRLPKPGNRGHTDLPRLAIGSAAPFPESVHVAPSPPRGHLSLSPSRLELHRRMSRKKIGLFAVGCRPCCRRCRCWRHGPGCRGGHRATPSPTQIATASKSPTRRHRSLRPRHRPRTRRPRLSRRRHLSQGPSSRSSTATPPGRAPERLETVRIIGIDTPSRRTRPSPSRASAQKRALSRKTPRRPSRHPRARPDPGRARPATTACLPMSTSATRCTQPSDRRRYGIHYVYERPSIHAAELDAAADTAPTPARHLGLMRWPGRPAPGPGRRPCARRGSRSQPPANADCHPSYDRASRTPATIWIAAISVSRSRHRPRRVPPRRLRQRRARLRELLMKDRYQAGYQAMRRAERFTSTSSGHRAARQFCSAEHVARSRRRSGRSSLTTGSIPSAQPKASQCMSLLPGGRKPRGDGQRTGRRIVAWTEHELNVVRDYCPEHYEGFRSQLREQRRAFAERWRNKCHGRDKPSTGHLSLYLRLIGYQVPP